MKPWVPPFVRYAPYDEEFTEYREQLRSEGWELMPQLPWSNWSGLKHTRRWEMGTTAGLRMAIRRRLHLMGLRHEDD